MLNPSVDELLASVAEVLRASVLPELPPGQAQEQLQAGIGIIRRAARSVGGLVPYLQVDTRDLAAELRELWSACPDLAPAADSDVWASVASAEALPAASLPTLAELTALNVRLRQAAADLAASPELDPAADRRLRDLLERITAREAGLRLSPWER